MSSAENILKYSLNRFVEIIGNVSLFKCHQWINDFSLLGLKIDEAGLKVTFKLSMISSEFYSGFENCTYHEVVHQPRKCWFPSWNLTLLELGQSLVNALVLFGTSWQFLISWKPLLFNWSKIYLYQINYMI